MYIPDGMAQVAPYIFAKNADAYMDHIIAALGGVEAGRSKMPNGKLANGQVRFGDASIMISECDGRFTASQCAMYLYVEDADAAMAQAIEHGMEKIMDVADQDYGDRQGGVKDKVGNIWWISQRLVDAPYDD
ncbi:MAG: VOC family protein [Marinicaulis sp.]|nr:hypothetical protein [Marinicaulis sp.]NNE41980.1 VOC family protein [Marinicaulis sp.]NNL88173.1 VOC family protein [Marinicaulis sp.]